MYDSESNLYYYRNRMYSPELARFISKDPKGYVDGMNLYAYVKNNPLRYLDPMGTTVRSSRSKDYDVVDYIENITMNGGSNNDLLLMLQASEIAKTFIESENVQSIVNDPSNRFVSNNNTQVFELYIGNTSKVTESNLIKVKDNQPIQQYQSSNIGSSIAEVAVKGYYGGYDKQIANSLRFAGTTFNVAGTTLLATPGGQELAVPFFIVSFASNYFAETFDLQPETLIRNSALDIMTSSMPGGFIKDAGVEVYKTILDNNAKKHEDLP